jgi:hypothetical protein
MVEMLEKKVNDDFYDNYGIETKQDKRDQRAFPLLFFTCLSGAFTGIYCGFSNSKNIPPVDNLALTSIPLAIGTVSGYDQGKMKNKRPYIGAASGMAIGAVSFLMFYAVGYTLGKISN